MQSPQPTREIKLPILNELAPSGAAELEQSEYTKRSKELYQIVENGEGLLAKMRVFCTSNNKQHWFHANIVRVFSKTPDTLCISFDQTMGNEQIYLCWAEGCMLEENKQSISGLIKFMREAQVFDKAAAEIAQENCKILLPIRDSWRELEKNVERMNEPPSKDQRVFPDLPEDFHIYRMVNGKGNAIAKWFAKNSTTTPAPESGARTPVAKRRVPMVIVPRQSRVPPTLPARSRPAFFSPVPDAKNPTTTPAPESGLQPVAKRRGPMVFVRKYEMQNRPHPLTPPKRSQPAFSSPVPYAKKQTHNSSGFKTTEKLTKEKMEELLAMKRFEIEMMKLENEALRIALQKRKIQKKENMRQRIKQERTVLETAVAVRDDVFMDKPETPSRRRIIGYTKRHLIDIN